MTERLSLRRQLHSSNERRRKHPPPRPSPTTSRAQSSSRRGKSIKPVKSLNRSASAPALCGAVDGEDRSGSECDEGVLTRGATSWDALPASPPSRAQSFRIAEVGEERGYNKEAKVVVNVTVEGSAGPIRTMVRLGSRVEDTIKVVIEKYRKEGRRPAFGKNDGVSFELHDSYFSLQSLGKSDLIGDVGSRSFYLRASRKGTDPTTFATRTASAPTEHPGFLFVPGFISRRICKFMRWACKLWKILGCIPSSG